MQCEAGAASAQMPQLGGRGRGRRRLWGVVHCVGISVCATHVTVSHVTKHRCFNRHFQLIAICNRVSSYDCGGNMLSTHATKRLTCHHTHPPLCTGHLPSALGARTWLYNVYIGPTLGAMGIASCTAIVSGVALRQLGKGVEGKEGV